MFFVKIMYWVPDTAERLIESIHTKLGVPATYAPFDNSKVTAEDLETGFEMLAFLMYCPWNNDPDKCATGAWGCRTGCRYSCHSYGCRFNSEWPLDPRDQATISLFHSA